MVKTKVVCLIKQWSVSSSILGEMAHWWVKQHTFFNCAKWHANVQRANVQLTVLSSQQSVTSSAWLALELCSGGHKNNLWKQTNVFSQIFSDSSAFQWVLYSKINVDTKSLFVHMIMRSMFFSFGSSLDVLKINVSISGDIHQPFEQFELSVQKNCSSFEQRELSVKKIVSLWNGSSCLVQKHLSTVPAICWKKTTQ